MRFEQYILNDTNLIKEAIQLIEMNRSRCVVIVNSNRKIVGILSEGDILRSILKA